MVHNYGDLLTESQSLCGTICYINHESIQIHCFGAYEHYLQHNLEITRDMNLSGSLNRLTNMLESSDNQGLRLNIVRTNTLYESQRCDNVVEVEHVRHKHPERN